MNFHLKNIKIVTKPKAINRKKLVALFCYYIAKPSTHVNGRDERASPAVDKFARLRCMVIKGATAKSAATPVHKKVAITMPNIDNRCRCLYNDVVEVCPHIKTE